MYVLLRVGLFVFFLFSAEAGPPPRNSNMTNVVERNKEPALQ